MFYFSVISIVYVMQYNQEPTATHPCDKEKKGKFLYYKAHSQSLSVPRVSTETPV